MSTIDLPTRDLASTTLGYVLEALAATSSYTYGGDPGLPASTVHVEERGALIGVTTASAPAYRSCLDALARAAYYDAALLRVNAVADGLVHVTADVTLALLPCRPWSMIDLALWAGRGGDLWLVSDGFGACVSITEDGLSAELVPPYETLAERAEGVFRAGGRLADLRRPVAVR